MWKTAQPFGAIGFDIVNVGWYNVGCRLRSALTMGESMRYQVVGQWMTSEAVFALFEFYDDAVRFAVDKFENDQLFHLANIYVVDVLNDYVYVKWERSHN